MSEITWDHMWVEKGNTIIEKSTMIVTLGRPGQEDSEFETSLGYSLDLFSYVHSCCVVLFNTHNAVE